MASIRFVEEPPISLSSPGGDTPGAVVKDIYRTQVPRGASHALVTEIKPGDLYRLDGKPWRGFGGSILGQVKDGARPKPHKVELPKSCREIHHTSARAVDFLYDGTELVENTGAHGFDAIAVARFATRAPGDLGDVGQYANGEHLILSSTAHTPAPLRFWTGSLPGQQLADFGSWVPASGPYEQPDQSNPYLVLDVTPYREVHMVSASESSGSTLPGHYGSTSFVANFSHGRLLDAFTEAAQVQHEVTTDNGAQGRARRVDIFTNGAPSTTTYTGPNSDDVQVFVHPMRAPFLIVRAYRMAVPGADSPVWLGGGVGVFGWR